MITNQIQYVVTVRTSTCSIRTLRYNLTHLRKYQIGMSSVSFGISDIRIAKAL